MKKQFVILVFLLWFIPSILRSQCAISYNGNLCVNNSIEFTGAATGTTHNYDFNTEGSSSGQRIVKFAFKTPGNKTVTYITTINGNKCTTTLNLVIKSSPTIHIRKLTKDTQCFENNLFCHLDSSYNVNGAKITRISHEPNDGQLFEFYTVKMPITPCFSYKDPRGGKVIVNYSIEDENGCISYDTFKNYGFVYPKIGARITRTTPKNPACDSVNVLVTNYSLINPNFVKTCKLNWGDGSSSTGVGPTFKHTYLKQGTFNANIIIAATFGCSDTFNFNAIATVVKSKVRIISNTDSVCISNPTVSFSLDSIPNAVTNMAWNFGDPGSAGKNVDSKNFNTSHTFSKIGPFQVSFSYTNPICSVPKVYDTILVFGPWSNIEKVNNRMAEFEVFQCTKQLQDSIHFKNLSNFYHNDNSPANDDSTVLVSGKLQHVFNSSQLSINPKNYSEYKNRSSANIQRIWDFGDIYASKCTTHTKTNAFVRNNCRFSRDSLPVHYYTSWENIMLKWFKNVSMEDAVFDENKRVCKKLLLYPSDSFYIIADTFITVPRSISDSALANQSPNVKTKFYLQEKYFYNGKRYISDYVDVKINSGASITAITPAGSAQSYNGPSTIALSPGYTLISKDTVHYLFTKKIVYDTLPFDFYNIRKNNGDKPAIISRKKYTFSGVKGVDYVVNFNRYRAIYLSRIPSAYTARLIQKDQVNPMHCESESTKQLVLMNADAGGVGSGLRYTGQLCFGGSEAGYGVTFLLNDLKPGATFSDVQINFDSFCGKNNFVKLNALAPGALPPGLPYRGYQLDGNSPNRFSYQYPLSGICNKTGCATIGIIVGNGVSKSGSKPLCADTQWYDSLICIDNPDAHFNMVSRLYKKDFMKDFGYMKICKNDGLRMRHPANNKTKPELLNQITYTIETINAGPNYSLYSNRFVQEDYAFNVFLKDSGQGKIYDYLVISRGGQDPIYDPAQNKWVEGKTKLFKKPDTIITAIISKWDTLADVSGAWDFIQPQLLARGFDPFSLDAKTLAHMVWNGKGTIGNPATGAKGCIDTSGYGNLIKWRLKPANGFKKIVHYRDTSLLPVDQFYDSSKLNHEYIFKPTWNGKYYASREMITKNNCDAYMQIPVIVGYGSVVTFPDSVACNKAGNTLAIKIDHRYFHPDPINFGTWDQTDYWRDNNRNFGQKNTEPLTKWDWNKADDNLTKPQTIFGGAPYGGSGNGTPWVQLGGGGPNALYYTQDSGIYTFRSISGDSTGCIDTFTGRVFISKLETHFNTFISTPSCNSIVEFYDSTLLFDPAKRVLKNADGSPASGDYIKSWYIDWGDGKNNLYSRAAETEPGLPPRITHKYTHNGWYQIKYAVNTKKGCTDTVAKWVKIPGPRPKFKFQKNAGFDIYINQFDSVEFVNTTDSFGSKAAFTWFFGDGSFKKTNNSIVKHAYALTGDYYVFLQQFDSLNYGIIHKYCDAIYPDTFSMQPMIVHVSTTNHSIQNTKENGITIYPNPGVGIFQLKGSDLEKIKVYSLTGTEIGTYQKRNNRFDLSQLPAGTYILKGNETNGTNWQLRMVLIK